MKTILSNFKKRIFMFFSFSFMVLLPMFAQTEISGTISKDSVLVLSGSPYVIPSYLTVQSGFTLTIQSGVTVKFNNSANLYVNGTLNATNVIFTSGNASPQPGNWGKIQIGDYWNTGSINLTDCEIAYGQEFSVYKGTTTLINTNVSNFLYNAIVVDAAGILNMTGGAISTTSADAMNNYDGVMANSDSHITLTGVHIQNYNYGIALNHNAQASIADLIISSCNYPISYNDVASLNVSGMNNFSGNNWTAVRIGFNYLSSVMTLPVIDIPYLFPWFEVQETGSLIIGTGNILKFQDNTTLNVKGALVANASVGENIFFTSYRDDNWGGDTNKDGTSTAPQSQNWNGIYFQDASSDTGCLLRRCMIRYAGGSQRGGISTFNASPTIDSCDISNNYIGVYMQGTSNPVLTNNTIGSSQMTPLAMSFEANPLMSSNTLSFSDNAFDAIGIIGGEMLANGTLKVRAFTDVPNLTYLILDEITVPSGKTLTINKGITIKSYSGDWYNHRIIVNGALIANATADSMINFTSARDDNYGYPADCNKDGTITSPIVSDWGGIIFNPGSSGTMNYCRVKYAQINYYSFSSCSVTESVNNTAIGIIDASPTISNCEFKDLHHAISCYRSASPTLTNNSMVNILFTPINISGPSNPTISGITFTNVGWRALGLLGGNVCLNGTIKKRDVAGFTNITYVLLSDMTINSGTYVNVESGVVIKGVNQYLNGYDFNGNNIFVDGGFKTDGTATQPVIFTSLKDDNAGNPFDTNGDGNASTPAGADWGSIKYRSTSNDAYCVLNYTFIKYPGNTNEGGVTFENAAGKLKNSTITNSSNYGVYCNGNSTPLIDSVAIQNCSLDPVAMSLTSNPAFSNISFTSNYSQAIKMIEGTLSTMATLAPRNMAGITNIAYIVDQLTISSNAKLTISPDVVVKFRGAGNTYIKVNGNLIANGTSDHKIYFTSFKDDSKGGDSNNNGNTDSPQKGDWGQGYCNWNGHWDETPGGIKFESNTLVSDTVNSLKYCEISYPTTGVRVENAHATIANSTIQLCNSFGATVAGSANPSFNICQFYNINYSPVEMSMFSNPTFTNNTALNVGYMAIGIIPETYSQSATVPIRDFGGYTNINYLMEGPCTINSGSTITIPAGVVFKSTNSISTSTYDHYWSSPGNIANGFIVNGGLKIEGTTANPVIFTNAQDDNYGNPADMNQNGMATLPPDGINTGWSGDWITFNDVSDDASSINKAIFKYGETGITNLSASPTINNTRFEKLYYGVDMNGVSAPRIDSCTFHNLQYYPIQVSLVSYPASTIGNLISGTTYKVIKVRDETLTQDVTLPKRNFGGKNNIPYFFHNYQIGTSASLTIAPGVICKFQRQGYWDNSGIGVSKGLIALGGSTPDSTIVFTSILDDFYGGDSNSDSTATQASISNYYDWSSYWSGLNFADQSLDPLCKMKNCVIRYADAGVNTTSASPSFEKCNFNNNNYGVKATAASNPSFSNCDFSENRYYAIDNVDKSFDINAVNCWWGTNAGPYLTDIQYETTSEMENVSGYVNYTPWKTTGTINPLTGDVSLNGLIQAYDASLVLKYTVGLLTLSAPQQQVADVSGASGITAYDASLILQYVVGMDATFPINKVKKSAVELNAVALTIGNARVGVSDESTVVPLSVANMDGMIGADIQLRFNPKYLQATAVENLLSSTLMEFNIDNVNGLITIAMARSVSLNGTGTLANLKFNVVSKESIVTDISVEKFLANEQDFTFAAIPGSITIMKSGTGFFITLEDKVQGMAALYPNPF
ncbi:MAG TPA: right-handed parallel beta-helix repeat-containing protein, partial [Paludibacter sp.]